MTTLEERFFAKVHPEPNTGCWLWGAAADKRGYGRIGTSSRKTNLATHVSLQIVGVTIPPGMCVCHKCDMPSCVNPEHLFVGTHADNMRDCLSKDRLPQAFTGGVCQAGHVIAETGVRFLTTGARICRACVRIYEREASRKKRAKRVAMGLTCDGKIRKGRGA